MRRRLTTWIWWLNAVAWNGWQIWLRSVCIQTSLCKKHHQNFYYSPHFPILLLDSMSTYLTPIILDLCGPRDGWKSGDTLSENNIYTTHGCPPNSSNLSQLTSKCLGTLSLQSLEVPLQIHSPGLFTLHIYGFETWAHGTWSEPPGGETNPIILR